MRLSREYNRGTGFFSSTLFKVLGNELRDFLSGGGKFRILTSVRLSEGDYQALLHGYNADAIVGDRIQSIIEDEFTPPISDGAQALIRLIQLGRLHLRIGVPPAGIYHEKIGYFVDSEDDVLAWNGSANDGEHAYEVNFEEVKVFTGWEPVRSDYAAMTVDDFNRRWSKDVHLRNLAVFDFPDAAPANLIELSAQTDEIRRRKQADHDDKWRHQEEAVNYFLAERDPLLSEPPRPAGRQGILCMATGTGKTRTACKIVRRLAEERAISRVIVTTHLVDVLDQWGREFDSLLPEFVQYRHYRGSAQLGEYRWSTSSSAVLICTRGAFQKYLAMTDNRRGTTLLIVDECHNYRGAGHVAAVGNLYEKVPYRLGLSATPHSPYSAAANAALESQIGPVFFEFGVEEAIRRRILCPFQYEAHQFELTTDERTELVATRRRFEGLIKAGEASHTDMWTALSAIYKLSVNKLPIFAHLLQAQPSILERCLIFVQTRAYGERVFELLLRHGGGNRDKWHHYFADAEVKQLERFRKGELECLVTCQKLNEGVDIKSVRTIVLFASEHGEDGLSTTQRIGRALRYDSSQPDKVARVIDFARADAKPESNDYARVQWLQRIGSIRPPGWEEQQT